MEMFKSYVFLLHVLYRLKLGYTSQMGSAAFIKGSFTPEINSQTDNFPVVI